MIHFISLPNKSLFRNGLISTSIRNGHFYDMLTAFLHMLRVEYTFPIGLNNIRTSEKCIFTVNRSMIGSNPRSFIFQSIDDLPVSPPQILINRYDFRRNRIYSHRISSQFTNRCLQKSIFVCSSYTVFSPFRSHACHIIFRSIRHWLTPQSDSQFTACVQ